MDSSALPWLIDGETLLLGLGQIAIIGALSIVHFRHKSQHRETMAKLERLAGVGPCREAGVPVHSAAPSARGQVIRLDGWRK
jgi:hypothetical protein